MYGKQFLGRKNTSKGQIEVEYLTNNRNKGIIVLNNLKDYLEQALVEKDKS